MRSKFGVTFTALGLAIGALALSDPVQAQGVQVGALTCNVESGFGFIVGSSRAVNCTFLSSNGPPNTISDRSAKSASLLGIYKVG
jgi:hypothetical protein